MREVVIVISDLYATPEVAAESQGEVSLPGLEQTVRFADRLQLTSGWRPWLLRWFVGDAAAEMRFLAEVGLAAVDVHPATIAALSLNELGPQERAGLRRNTACWMASPVHLVAGLTSLHLDRRSVMRLPMRELSALADDFDRVFGETSWRLQPLASGAFLLTGPGVAEPDGGEPERLVGLDLASSGLTGRHDVNRLRAEIQMWLHEHPVNKTRIAAGGRPVSALWLWGGGTLPPRSETPQARSNGAAESRVAFGDEACLRGICASLGVIARELPSQLAPVFSYPRAYRGVLVLEAGRMLEANLQWAFSDALMHIDRDFLQPALLALRERKLGRLIVLANDRVYVVRPHQRFRFWRRSRRGLAALA